MLRSGRAQAPLCSCVAPSRDVSLTPFPSPRVPPSAKHAWQPLTPPLIPNSCPFSSGNVQTWQAAPLQLYLPKTTSTVISEVVVENLVRDQVRGDDSASGCRSMCYRNTVYDALRRHFGGGDGGPGA